MTETSILLVDDDTIVNFLSERILTNMGFRNITAVTDGKQARDSIKDNCPDLVFLDINMPVMDGFGFLNQILKEVLCAKMKVVILSSSNRESDKIKAVQFSSVIDYIEKPLNQDKVQQVLEGVN
ncbi:MAG: two-component system nitrate/nitrite response regulator NarL [Candidatus Latescibacterota bacterium]|jgi:two-component system nitrate/nitrite response regulator NarL